jgi:hypothetical protein
VTALSEAGQAGAGAGQAEFQGHFFQSLACATSNLAASPGGTGEGHHIDAGVASKDVTNPRPGAMDNVEHSCGKAGVVREFGLEIGREGGEFTGLDDHGAASGERSRDGLALGSVGSSLNPRAGSSRA